MTSWRRNRISEALFVTDLTLGCVLFCGCEQTVQSEPLDEGLVNAQLINTLNDVAMENAIIAQHTLYPYHFVKDSEKLNKLGQRDLSILAKRLTNKDGQLNIRRDGISKSLYQARLAYVAGQLQQAGIDPARVNLSDGMPGGRGMPSSDVVQIRQADQEARKDRRERYPQMSTEGTD